MKSWEAACKGGKCNDVQNKFWNAKPVEELYDTENDPWEVNNLAGNPQYIDVLERMRKAQHDWILKIKDTGFVPEAELAGRVQGATAYDYMRNSDINLAKWVEVADAATRATSDDIALLEGYLTSEDAAVRYWGATGFLILKDEARPALPLLKKAAADPSPNVAVVAAEALYRMGEKEAAKLAFIELLKAPNAFARAHALNAIAAVEEDSREIQSAVIAMVKGLAELNSQHYDWRSARGLLTKWKVDPKKHNLDFEL